MSEQEARDLLGLPKNCCLDKAAIDTQFNRVFRTQQAKLNAVFTKKDRDKELNTQILMEEAHKICLNNVGINKQTTAQNTTSPGTSRWTGRSQTVFQPIRRRYVGNGGVQKAGMHFCGVFTHLWWAVKDLFLFIATVPSAFIEIKNIISDVLDQIEVAGIPKPVVILVIIVGSIPLISGCAHAIPHIANSLDSLINWFIRVIHRT